MECAFTQTTCFYYDIILNFNVYLQRRAHNDEQISFWEIFSVQEILLRKVLSEKHNIRFDRCGTKCAYGDVVIHYRPLLDKKHAGKINVASSAWDSYII